MPEIAHTPTIDEVVEALRRLPQAGVIPEERMRVWADRTIAVDGSRTLWHARRASGIGSSEIGALVAARHNLDAYDTPRDVIAGKLLFATPDAGTVDTNRGIRAKPFVRESFIAQMAERGITVRRNEAAFNAVATARHPDHPWLIGSPDDVLDFDGPNGVQTWIVDYKVPRSSTLAEYREAGGSPLGYVCQLHHCGILAREVAALDVHGYGNIYFDLEAWSSELWTVPYEADYDREIKAAGDAYWNEFVLAGVLPPYAVRPVLEVDGGLPPDLRRMAAEMTRLSLLGDQIYLRKKDPKARIEDEIRRLGRVEDGELPLAAEVVLKVTAKRDVDVDAMIECLRRAGERGFVIGYVLAGVALVAVAATVGGNVLSGILQANNTQQAITTTRANLDSAASGLAAATVQATLDAAGSGGRDPSRAEAPDEAWTLPGVGAWTLPG
jgi:hypothetical protein